MLVLAQVLALLRRNNEEVRQEQLLKQILEIRQKIRLHNTSEQYRLYLEKKLDCYPNQHLLFVESRLL